VDSLKLTKQVQKAAEEAGFLEPREVQTKTLSRIIGGHELIIVGPEGCGKTSTLVLGVLSRLKYTQDEPPRALILVPDKERVLALVEQFQLLGKHTGIKALGLYPGVGMEGQREALAEGVDVVIGTPERIHAIYLKSGLNINKIKMFILDDAEYIVKQGFQTIVHQTAERLPKCQHIVFSEVFHTKLDLLTKPFLNFPTLIEVSAVSEEVVETVDLILYNVPNYKTKLNLLNLLLGDGDAYPKVVVFANTRITSESLYKSLHKRIPGEVALLHSKNSAEFKFDSTEDFKNAAEVRVLIVTNEEKESLNIQDIPFLLHFDVPVSKEEFISRVQKTSGEDTRQSITFSTDIELSLIAKIEQAIGHKMQIEELPLGLIVEGDRQSHQNDEKQEPKADPEKNSAFQEKKASNAKTHNFKYKDRLKMFGKKHRKDKRGE